MGRHRLDPSAARIHRVAVMFTADEYERVQAPPPRVAAS